MAVDACGCTTPSEDRPPPNERGYGHKWRLFRAWFIDRHPRCEECLSKGIDNRSQLEVHHMEKIKSNPTQQYDEANCMTLCKACHAARTLKGE